MSITDAELKENLNKSSKLTDKLSKPYQDRVELAKSLAGSIPADITLEEAREERLSIYERNSL